MLNKNNIKKKIALTVLAGSLLSTSLTGCYASALDNTMLEGTVVVTFENGTKDIAVQHRVIEDNYVIYRSVISETYYTDDDCTKNKYRTLILENYPIENVEQISSYLTEEDFKELRGPNKYDTVTTIVSRIISTNDTARIRE